jgi:phenylpyruvate tautomerase PptA (4-oxalocrotonate tautomerase family)
MPVYIIHATEGSLAPAVKTRIAAEITKAHRDLTGTQGFLVQVIFKEQAPGNVFLGGTPQAKHNVFVQGLHRAGRPPELKKTLTRRLVDCIAEAASISRRYIWIYVDERPAAQMVEYGHLLPEPGNEVEWLHNLPSDDRNYLEEIDRQASAG